MTAEPIRVALQVTETLEALGIPYFIGGSIASSLLGVPRTTEDVDIIAAIGPGHVEGLVARLVAEFHVDRDEVVEAVRTSSVFNVIHRAEIQKIDIFIAGTRGLDLEEMRRRVRHRLSQHPDCAVFVATPEDVILKKLSWYRDGGEVSERQWRDVLGILKIQAPSLDMAYLHRWAEVESVRGLLERALGEAGVAGGE